MTTAMKAAPAHSFIGGLIESVTADIKDLENDCVLPAQWRDMHSGADTPPWKRLMAAVFEEAINDWHRTKDKAERCHLWAHQRRYGLERHAIELVNWFASNDRNHVFAFCTLCDVFGIEPNKVRAALPQLKKAQKITRRIAESSYNAMRGT